MRFTGLVATGLLLLGCGSEGGSLYVKPFQAVGGVPLTSLPLTVGQSHTLKLRLSDNVSDVTYVDADYQQYKEFIVITPEVIKFKSGEGANGADITIKGLKATPVGGVDVLFKLRDSIEARKLNVRVSDQVIPDAGPLPDQGPTPDGGTPTPEGGTPTQDGGTPTPEGGTPTPDAAAGD